jgi:hypothetical protein
MAMIIANGYSIIVPGEDAVVPLPVVVVTAAGVLLSVAMVTAAGVPSPVCVVTSPQVIFA